MKWNFQRIYGCWESSFSHGKLCWQSWHYIIREVWLVIHCNSCQVIFNFLPTWGKHRTSVINESTDFCDMACLDLSWLAFSSFRVLCPFFTTSLETLFLLWHCKLSVSTQLRIVVSLSCWFPLCHWHCTASYMTVTRVPDVAFPFSVNTACTKWHHSLKIRALMASVSTNGLFDFVCLTGFSNFDLNELRIIWLIITKLRSFRMKDCLCHFMASNKYFTTNWKEISG